MSVFSSFRQWLALRLRPAEPAPDAQDLNLPRPLLPPEVAGQQGGELEAAAGRELRRRVRLAQWRAGPWQQK